MAIGGFLQGLGLAAGRNIIVGQEMADKQSLIDERRADVQYKQQQLANMAAQQQTQKEVGSYIASEIDKDASVVSDPIKSAKLYENAAGIALRSGDFTSANTMSGLAKQQLAEAKEAAQAQAQQMQLKKEDLANEADSFATNPTQEGYQRLVQKAVAAGVNPQSIPKPNTPAFGAWVNQQQLASKTASERADFIQKQVKAAEEHQEKVIEHQDRERDVHARMAQTAMLRETSEKNRLTQLRIEQDRLDLDREKFKATQEGGGRQGTQMQRDTTAIAGAAADAARNLKQLSQFPLTIGTSPFSNLSDKTFLDAIAKAGVNSITPDLNQMFQTAGAGLALQVGRVETAGGGRGVNQVQVDKLEKQLTPLATDQPLTKLYKIATGSALLATRMENQPPPRDPTLKANWDKTYKELTSYPDPNDILQAAIKAGKGSKEILDFQKSYLDNLALVRADVAAHPAETEGSPVPSAAPAGAQVPGLPTGGLSSSDIDLINKHLKK